MSFYTLFSHLRGDIDDWDPMSFDHKSRTFNSYEEGGLGAVMQNCQESGTKTINLFVNKIPAAVTKVQSS